jgi:hypothetical protein
MIFIRQKMITFAIVQFLHALTRNYYIITRKLTQNRETLRLTMDLSR